jgi:hypothetical protein
VLHIYNISNLRVKATANKLKRASDCQTSAQQDLGFNCVAEEVENRHQIMYSYKSRFFKYVNEEIMII